MKLKPGILLGIPVLLFFAWFIWTKGIAYQEFSLWAAEIPERLQVVDPEAVSRYRAGDVADYPGFFYQLTPRTEEQRIREEQFWKTIREERLAFPQSELDSTQQELYDRLAAHESQFLDIPWQWWAMNLFNPITGVQVRLQELLIYKHHIAEVDDCEGYINRLREVPERLREALRETKQVARSGWVLDSLVLKEAVAQLRAWASVSVREQALYRSFATRMTRLDPTVINEYEQIDFLVEASNILEEELLPALNTIADELSQLPRRAPGLKHLPVNLYPILRLVHAGDTIVSLQQPGIDQLDFSSYPGPASPISTIDPATVLQQIRQSTAGILPAYPAQQVRARVPDASQVFGLPHLIAGTSDQTHFPVYLGPDSGRVHQMILDLYQHGIPGAGWLSQLELEKGESRGGVVLDQRARYAGWGLASLDLLQEKLLWFSRDSALLQRFTDQSIEVAILAELEAYIQSDEGEIGDLDQLPWWQGLDEKKRRSILIPILAQPGMAAGRSVWYEKWLIRLKACEWDVSCALGW